MGSFTVLKFRGLRTADNQLSGVPDGSASVAKNVVNRYPHTLEPRRGQKKLGYSAGGITNTGVYYRDTLLVQYGTTLARDTGSAFSAFSGTFEPVDDDTLRMKFCEANSNLYVATAAGTKVLTSETATPVIAGLPRPLKVDGTNRTTYGWQTYDTSVGYRATIGIRDENGNQKEGPPSGRFVLRNALHVAIGGLVRTGGTTVTVTLDADATHTLSNGDTFTLTPGEADFVTGVKTVTGTTAHTVTYAEAGANVSSTLAQDCEMTRSALLLVYLPAGLTARHFVRLYRSEESASASDEPLDENYLVHESDIDSTDLSNGYVTISDVTPETFLGDPLYTNANSGDGPLAANDAPPIASDLVLFQGRQFFWNYTEKARRIIQLIGVGSPDGLQAGDRVFIDGPVGGVLYYEAKVTPGAANEFKLYSSGTASQNIERTAKALIDVVNADANNDSYLYYVSGDDDPPGKILIEERGIGGNPLSFVVDCPARLTAWTGMVVPDGSGNYSGAETATPNGCMYSKRDEPEAVPLLNKFSVGPRDGHVLRAISFRDKQFVFLKEAGIYTVAGEQPPFRTDLLDDTVNLVAPDTVVTHSNQVYALTDQGFAQVSDAGVRIVSGPLDDILVRLLNEAPDAVKRLAFAVSYESERLCLLWLPEDASSTSATQAYVYNSAADTWVGPWPTNRTWGLVRKSTRELYLGDGDSGAIRKERKNLDRTDFADEDFEVATIESVDTGDGSFAVTIEEPVSTVDVGDLLTQAIPGGEATALIIAVDENTNALTLDREAPFVFGDPAVIEKSFPVEVRWTPAAPDGADILKQFRSAVLHTRRLVARALSFLFRSEVQESEGTVTVSREGFGSPAFGSQSWGDTTRPSKYRKEVPRNQQRAAQVEVGFSMREARGDFAVYGYSLTYEPQSERTGR
jgi:hypothetical protein